MIDDRTAFLPDYGIVGMELFRGGWDFVHISVGCDLFLVGRGILASVVQNRNWRVNAYFISQPASQPAAKPSLLSGSTKKRY